MDVVLASVVFLTAYTLCLVSLGLSVTLFVKFFEIHERVINAEWEIKRVKETPAELVTDQMEPGAYNLRTDPITKQKVYVKAEYNPLDDLYPPSDDLVSELMKTHG